MPATVSMADEDAGRENAIRAICQPSQNIQSINQKEEKEMRSVLKACDLEDRFPILAVENNCIVSRMRTLR